MSILNAIFNYATTIKPPADYPDLLLSLKEDLCVNPDIQFVNLGMKPVLKAGEVRGGTAFLEENRIEINLHASTKLVRGLGFKETLCHECRHIWQADNEVDVMTDNYYFLIAQHVADYTPTAAEARFLRKKCANGKNWPMLAYLMRWHEIDSRGFACWYLNEKDQGIPYVEPQLDGELLLELSDRYDCFIVDIPPNILFEAAFKRMMKVEARIQKYAKHGVH